MTMPSYGLSRTAVRFFPDSHASVHRIGLHVLRIRNGVNIEAAEPPGSQGASKRRVPMRYASETQRREAGWIGGRM
jgi:hypothetical protein